MLYRALRFFGWIFCLVAIANVVAGAIGLGAMGAQSAAEQGASQGATTGSAVAGGVLGGAAGLLFSVVPVVCAGVCFALGNALRPTRRRRGRR